jgi:hypothetical protein
MMTMAAAPLAAPSAPPSASHAPPTAATQQQRRCRQTRRRPPLSSSSSSSRPLLLRCEAVAAPANTFAATAASGGSSSSGPTPPPPTPIAAVGAPSCRLVKDVAVDVQRTSLSSRVLHAAVDIAAPPLAVWGALTDYARLADFIPSLESNECLAHDPSSGTARLRQVGAQDVAMGVKFRAAVTLDIREHVGQGGIPPALVTTSGDSRDYLGAGARFPMPVAAPGEDDDDGGGLADAARAMARGDEEAGGLRSSSSSAASTMGEDDDAWPRDISFELVEGDFNAFRGVWRVDRGPAGPLTSRLAYAVFVQPQAFLPVGLIQGRISRDVATNLKSVRAHAEEVAFERLLRQQEAVAEAVVARA